MAVAGISGTLASCFVDEFNDTSSRIFISLATIAGGYVGWWWSTGKTPEECFNSTAKLLVHDNTQYIMSTILDAASNDDIFSKTDQFFSCHQFPRVKLILTIDQLLYDLSNARNGLRDSIASEIDRSSPNRFLIEQGRVYIQEIDRYISTLNQWAPELKKDITFLLQNVSYLAQQAKEAAERAESEARSASMDASMARYEALCKAREDQLARLTPKERLEADKKIKESGFFC